MLGSIAAALVRLAVALGRAGAFVTLAALLGAAGSAHAEVLREWTVAAPLGRTWTDELVHWDVALDPPIDALRLADGKGSARTLQLTDVRRDGAGRIAAARVWTLLSASPDAAQTVRLMRGPAERATPAVSLRREPGVMILANDRVAVRIPDYAGHSVARLVDLPPPLDGVRGREPAEWRARARWVASASVLVQRATTRVLEEGPLRIVVAERIELGGGQTYEVRVAVTAHQEAAQIAEDATGDLGVALRLDLAGSKRVVWHNQGQPTAHAGKWSVVDTAVDEAAPAERPVCTLRPWSFWWLGDTSAWAAFGAPGRSEVVGITLLRPSRWSPTGWKGYAATALPITTRDGAVALELPIVAGLHREWALSSISSGPAAALARTLRAQLVRYGEFPLDEVKDFGFGFAPAETGHPSLVVTPAALLRSRRQAQEIPAIRAEVEENLHFLAQNHGEQIIRDHGWRHYYAHNYLGNNLVARLPEAVLASDEPGYRRLLAAAVLGLAQQVRNDFLDEPSRPALSAYGPWITETATRLALAYDLVAGSAALSGPEEASVRDALVLAAHALSHPDFWDVSKGLASANPNMTSSIVLPVGLLGLALRGHPHAQRWVDAAERELAEEQKTWISPGGAWIENPAYQAAALDGILLFATALRNGTGRDVFDKGPLGATLDYFGFLLTPPDGRFAGRGSPTPATLPSIGDAFPGGTTPFNGWMAAALAKLDPEASARQQFYWRAQGAPKARAGRANGWMRALTDPGLPARAPSSTSRGFPGFGGVLRTSWTDPAAVYLVHRTGPLSHHYHDDYNSIGLYGSGGALCVDFGDATRTAAWLHNRVSWSDGSSPAVGSKGELVTVASVPGMADVSIGISRGGGNQADRRTAVLVHAPTQGTPGYVVVRDSTVDGQPGQSFHYNLWCLADDLAIGDRRLSPAVGDRLQAPVTAPVAFKGQRGTDVDLHLLSPEHAALTVERLISQQSIYTWGAFTESQLGVHVTKRGSAEDFFSVLWPRPAGERPIAVTLEGDGVVVRYPGGVDHVLVADHATATLVADDVVLAGGIAFARTGRELALAVLQGGRAAARGWAIAGEGQVGLRVSAGEAILQTDGAPRTIEISAPPEIASRLELDGRRLAARGATVRVTVAAGTHRSRLSWTGSRAP